MPFIRWAIVLSLTILQSACGAGSVPLVMPPGSHATAAHHNAQGIVTYENGEWGMARYHFGTAIVLDPQLAEAHFNLGLALDKLDLHSEAATHFRKAAELAPRNSAITESRAYKQHTAPSSSFSSTVPVQKEPGVWTDRYGRQERHFEIYRTP